MINYLAMIWNDADHSSSATARSLVRRFMDGARSWQTVVDQPGLIVCCEIRADSAADRPHVLPENRGVVLGKLFDRRYANRSDTHTEQPNRVVLDTRQTAGVIASAGENLVRGYWGAYVAFLRDSAARASWVIRDPSGVVPCHRTQVLGIDVYFVRLEDRERLAPAPFSINGHFLVGYLVYSSTGVRATALNEVEIVLPGERIEHRGDSRSRTFVWNPLEIAHADVIEDPGEAARLTRETVRACVHAWSSCFGGILHSLSGGLDSSIVLACLADAPSKPRVLCRHDHDPAGSADERAYARQAARMAGFELVERPVGSNLQPAAVTHFATRSLYPVGWPIDLDDDRARNEDLRARGFSAEFTGHGGDEVFFRGGSLHTAVDYAWVHGVRPGLLRVALDDAELSQSSIWQVLRWVYRCGLRKRPWHMRASVSASHMTLMAASVKKDARADLAHWHPLFRETVKVPPGKLEHAYVLAYSTSRSHDLLRGDDVPVYMFPLLSQPILELSLRTPVYVLRAGGRDRAVARRAFSGYVPAEIIARKSKSFGTERARALVVQNLGLIREVLLDGFLVREGLLDRARLAEVLSGNVSRIKAEALEICDYMSVETWAQNWSGTSRGEPRGLAQPRELIATMSS